MLRRLDIRDVVLIDRLSLDFSPGLCVLTGETGAGKSILLDSLGLALGTRAEARLVRAGTEQAVVSAEFDWPLDQTLCARLDEQGVPDEEGSLILRRILTKEGRSRAFVNDMSVSVGFLREIGDRLVEIHGQFDSHRLLNPATHLGLLDAFGNLGSALGACRAAWTTWADAARARDTAAETLEQARRDEEFLRHAADELRALDPQSGEEAQLAQDRSRLMHGEKLIAALDEARQALETHQAETGIQTALAALSRVQGQAEGALDDTIGALDRAAAELADGLSELARAGETLDLDPSHQERVEERLFALRAAARKHGAEVEGLPALRADFEVKLEALDTGSETLARLEQEAAAARQEYLRAAGALRDGRGKVASRLDQQVMTELEPLKLGGAQFVTALEPLEEGQWSATGMDRAAFQIATNPGAAPGPLNKIASGGEMARFMLALKVVLAEADSVPSLIFDEVDAGIGGATAAAVGARLAKLGETAQVLVVTHSPQVAAKGASHLKVSKQANGGGTSTTVEPLADEGREGELARMLAGAVVTEEARAAARTLLAGGEG